MTTIILKCKLIDLPESFINNETNEIEAFNCQLQANNGDKINYTISEQYNPEMFKKLMEVVKGMLFITDIPTITLHRIIMT